MNTTKISERTEKQKVKEITDKLEEGLKNLFDSEHFKEYLRVMSKFHNYSYSNSLLIAMQCPEATRVAGYRMWQTDFDRHVKKGEKAIRIIAPSPYKIKTEQNKLDPVTGELMIDENGSPVKEVSEISRPAFRVVSVFDVSQTEGKPLPDTPVKELLSSVDGYEYFKQAIINTAPVPVTFDNISGSAKGYFSRAENRIVIRKDMAQSQTLKTLIHETAHSLLHDQDSVDENKAAGIIKSRNMKEVEAESVAYTVCQHFNIDTSDYSFGYIAGWSNDKDMQELKASLDTIRETASKLITDLEAQMEELYLVNQPAQRQEFVLAVTNSDYSRLDLLTVRGMERSELFENLFAMTNADTGNAESYLEGCSAFVTHLGDEHTETLNPPQIDYIYDADTCKIIDAAQLETEMIEMEP